MLYFGAFGFDVGTGRLTRDGADVALGRTAARVLKCAQTASRRPCRAGSFGWSANRSSTWRHSAVCQSAIS
jgi:hypothetical protein